MNRSLRQPFRKTPVLAVAVLLASLSASASSAQEPIQAAGNWMWRSITQHRCLQLAGNALRTASSRFELDLSFCEHDGWFVVGEQPDLRLAIRCIADDDTPKLVSAEAERVLTTIEVTTTRSKLAPRLRTFLGRCMRGEPCGQAPNAGEAADEETMPEEDEGSR